MAEESESSAGADEVTSWTSATETLREVVKWVAAAFGALGALLIGTAPLSNIAKADLGGWFAVAVLGGLVGLACVGWIFWLSTSLLVPDPLELTDLQDSKYANLIASVNRNPVDYLGSNGRTFNEFLALRAQDRGHLAAVDERYGVEPDPAVRENLLKGREKLLARLETSGTVRARLLAWADFTKLRNDFEAARLRMFIGAIGAALGITVFHVATGQAVPDKDDKDSSSAAVVLSCWGDGPAFERCPGRTL